MGIQYKRIVNCGRFSVILFLLWFVATPVLATVDENGLSAPPNRHALLIGVSDYTSSGAPHLSDLPGAANDLTLIAAVLQSRLGFAPENITVLRDNEATHARIEQAFQALAEQVQPGDQVYIHFSGHGSYLPDTQGHKPKGLHQTWVSYGARAVQEGAPEIDRFDILDDQLNQWLEPIDRKAGELIYVSDSCHAATNTRSPQALAIRAAPSDDQLEHPRRGQRAAPYQFQNAVLIYAARYDQVAVEITADNQQRQGLFTWHWESALQNVQPGETWEQVFTRAKHGVLRSNNQRPQSEGPGLGRPVLGGEVNPRPAIMVKQVGERLTLNAGVLSGVTVGSRYGREGESSAEVEVTATSSTFSFAKLLHGEVAVGDFLTETHRAYHTAPLKLFFMANAESARSPLGARIQALYPAAETENNTTGYEWVSEPAAADLIIALLRPRLHEGAPVFSMTDRGRNSLPNEAEDAPFEVWVLTPSEQLLGEAFRIPLESQMRGLNTLQQNLTRYRQAQFLYELAQSNSQGRARVAMRMIPYQSCQERADPSCQAVLPGIADRFYRRQEDRAVSSTELSTYTARVGDVVSFEYENQSLFNDLHVYLLNIAPNGAIRVVFPLRNTPGDSARLKMGETLRLADEQVFVRMDEPGNEAFLVLTSRQAINPYLLEQDGYVRVRASKRLGLNPLEQLLGNGMIGLRSNTTAAITNWSMQWLELEVHDDTDE